MPSISRREALLLFLGDILSLTLALYLTLLVRYRAIPDFDTFYNHVVPFSFLFLLSSLVFFIAGLYDKHTLILKGKLSDTIFRAQIVNVIIAALFFFTIPYFGITPKTNLLIYLLLSTGLILLWRLTLFSRIRASRKYGGILIGSGREFDDLLREIAHNNRYSINFLTTLNPRELSREELREQAFAQLRKGSVSIIIIDTSRNTVEDLFPEWYGMMLRGVRFVDASKLYEDIFDRVPLEVIDHSWFLDYTLRSSTVIYRIMKRTIDVFVGIVGGLITLPFYPFVWLAMQLDDRGPLFFVQERVGENGELYQNVKFRTMQVHREESGLAKDPTVTRVGKFLRRTNIDEFPQFWNLLQGDISLVGPRPEVPALVEVYNREVPYYHVRHLVKPGLSGWAQVCDYDAPRKNADVEKTKRKLSYDLYYIKRQSLLLDVEIMLKTIKAFLVRASG